MITVLAISIVILLLATDVFLFDICRGMRRFSAIYAKKISEKVEEKGEKASVGKEKSIEELEKENEEMEPGSEENLKSDDYESNENNENDENDENDGAAEISETAEYEVDEEVYFDEANEQPGEETAVIYDMSEEVNNTGDVNMIILPIVVIAIVMIVFYLSIYLNRKKKRDEENSLNEIKGKIKSEKKREPFESAFETETVCLNQNDDDDTDTGTRLLFQTKEGIDITLEDRANPTKYFRACVRDAICIGRSDKLCDIPITYDDSVSSRHCEIYQRDSVLYCRDLGSSNGTMINQQKVYQEVKIESGDILRIGRLSFFVQIVGDSYGR